MLRFCSFHACSSASWEEPGTLRHLQYTRAAIYAMWQPCRACFWWETTIGIHVTDTTTEPRDLNLTACMVFDVNREISSSRQWPSLFCLVQERLPNPHVCDYTRCEHPPVKLLRAIPHAVKQSHEISRAALREPRKAQLLPLTSRVDLYCVARHGRQAVVYHLSYMACRPVQAHHDFPMQRDGMVSCGHACITNNERTHTTHGILHLRSQHVGFLTITACATPTTWMTLLAGRQVGHGRCCTRQRLARQSCYIRDLRNGASCDGNVLPIDFIHRSSSSLFLFYRQSWRLIMLCYQVTPVLQHPASLPPLVRFARIISHLRRTRETIPWKSHYRACRTYRRNNGSPSHWRAERA